MRSNVEPSHLNVCNRGFYSICVKYAENKLDKVQLEKHLVTPMTKDQQAEVILQVVREYSDCQQLIGTLECHLRKLGKLMLQHGEKLHKDPSNVKIADIMDLSDGEPVKTRKELERAYDQRQDLTLQLNQVGLRGLTLKD